MAVKGDPLLDALVASEEVAPDLGHDGEPAPKLTVPELWIKSWCVLRDCLGCKLSGLHGVVDAFIGHRHDESCSVSHKEDVSRTEGSTIPRGDSARTPLASQVQ